MNRDKRAMDLFRHTCCENSIDVDMIKNVPRWVTDTKLDVAIFIHSRRVAAEGSGGQNGFAWAQVGKVTVYACYITPNATAERCERFLGELGGSLVTELVRLK